MADLSKFSIEDLQALKSGDLSRVSTSGLRMLKGTSTAAERVQNDAISRGAREAVNPQGAVETGARWFYGDPNATAPERLAANPLTRFAVGAASPFLGAAQLASNAMGAIDSGNKMGQGDNALLQQFDQMKRAGGAGGFDAMGTLGTVMSPAALMAMKIAPAATVMGRAGQGAGVGATAGAVTPVTNGGEDFWSDKSAQIGTGAAIGGVIPLGVDAVRKGATLARNIIDPALPGGVDRVVGRTLNTAAGADKPRVMDALRNVDDFVPGSPVTAGEAASKVGRAEFSGIESLTRAAEPTPFDVIRIAQNTARANAIRQFGGTPETIKTAEKARDALTAPMRARALENANIAGVKVPQLQGRIAERGAQAADAVQDVRRFTAAGDRLAATPNATESGQLRVPFKYSREAELAAQAENRAGSEAGMSLQRGAESRLSQYQLDSLAAHGHYPLKANKVVGSIDKMLSTPGDRAVTLNQQVLGRVRQKIASLADKNGVIDSRDLYAIRKSEINDVVAQLTKDMDAGTKNRAASLVSSIKNDIDNAIEGAGGMGWKDYLKTYAGETRKIDQMRIGQELEKKLVAPISDVGTEAQQRAAAYAQTLRDPSQMISKATGAPRYQSLEQGLLPENAEIARNVGKDLGRVAENTRLGVIGNQKAAKIIGDVDLGRLPNALHRPIMVFNAVLNRISGKLTEASKLRMSEVLQDPKLTLKVMEAATPSEKAAMLDLLLLQKGGMATVIGGSSAAAQGVQ